MSEPDASILRRADQTGLPLLAARLILGCVFVYMGALKAGDPVAFLKSIRQFEMMPESPAYLLNTTAIVLPWLEIFSGVALLIGAYIRGAAAMIVLMLSVFTPAILLRALAVGAETGTPFFEIEFDCGCGTGETIIWSKLLTNAGLWVIGLVAIFSRSRRFTLDLWLSRRSPRSPYCHLCGYTVAEPTPSGRHPADAAPAAGQPRNEAGFAGLCERCATPPAIPAAATT